MPDPMPAIKRRFERMVRQPERLVALGDAVCSFNPIYGQGMTTAGLGAVTLDACLRQKDLTDGFSYHFQQRLAKVQEFPWQFACSADLRVPGVTGSERGGANRIAKLIQRYINHVIEVTPSSPTAAQAFLEVIHMVSPPTVFFQPAIVFKVLTRPRRKQAWILLIAEVLNAQGLETVKGRPWCASAGSGKTTLLSQWARQSPHPVAWLSLDTSDNEPTRFWASVITTLVRSCPGLSQVGNLTLAMLSDAQPPPLSTILTTLINEPAQCSHEIMLILDDYQVIGDCGIQEAMHFLLDHLPANLHLILSSRVDPVLPLARFRMRGQLVEIREADVRFTREEADHFLRDGMQLSLSRRGRTLSRPHRGLDGRSARRHAGWHAHRIRCLASRGSRPHPRASLLTRRSW
jgi:hypothetical protein